MSVHETAIIDEPSEIGRDCEIYHWTHIRERAKIGHYTKIGQGCYIGEGVKIGERCRIQNGVNIFAGVTLEDDVFCGPGVTFTNVKLPQAGTVQPPQPTLVKKGAMIGANATIICGIEIGEGAIIGAGSVVTHDVPDNATVWGNPARVQMRKR